MTVATYDPSELDRFREVQQLAYRAATETAARLEPGVTEKQAAEMMADWLRMRGVSSYFHQPFAWFGDRTCFTGFARPTAFFPTDRRLEKDMPAILDVAPIVDGYVADIGYSFSIGNNSVLEESLDALERFRGLILERVRAGDCIGEIYRRVDELLYELGYRNCHRMYPFGVLAHRIYRQPRHPIAGRPVLGFGLSAAAGLLAQAVAARVPGMGQRAPFIYTGPGSEDRPEPGLWAVEPHIARGDVGAKWEEILVIGESDAHWLDDDLPHVNRWRERTRASA